MSKGDRLDSFFFVFQSKSNEIAWFNSIIHGGNKNSLRNQYMSFFYRNGKDQ
jgi:hypothetical protein